MAEDSTAQLATSQCVSQVFMPLESTLFVLPKAQICSFEPLTPGGSETDVREKFFLRVID